MTKLELKDQVKRGERARQLLKDPMIQDFLKELRETIYHNIRTSHFKDIPEREDLYKMLQVTDRFEGIFNRHVNTGKIAQSKLDQMKEKVTNIANRLKNLP